MESQEAERLARQYVEYASNTMILEGQEITDEENQAMVKRWTKKLMEEE